MGDILRSDTKPVSLVVITYDEGPELLDLFRDLFAELPAHRPAEVIVVHNGGANKTLQLVHQACSLSPVPFHIELAHKNNLGFSRSLGVAKAIHPWVAFVDGDCRVFPGWLKDLADNLKILINEDPATGGVGGPNRLDPVAPLGQTLNLLLESPLGHGGSPQGQQVLAAKMADHLATTNALFVREVILKAGNFSADFPRTCEDVDLGLRINQSGRHLYLLPHPQVINQSALSWKQWSSRMIRFGQAQAQLISPKRKSLHPPSVVSAMGVVGALSLPVLGLYQPQVFWLAAFYGAALTIEAWRICLKGHRGQLVFSLAGAMALTHFSYGWGSLKGYLQRFLFLNKGQVTQASQAD